MTLSRTKLAAIWPPTASAAAEAGHVQTSPLSTAAKLKNGLQQADALESEAV